MNDAPVHDKVALRVITFLGVALVLAVAGVIALVHESIRSANEIDPSTVALVAGVSTLAGTALGVLGSILVRTPQGAQPPAGTAADPVNVKTAEQPLEVTPVEPHPDAPASSDL